MSSAVASSIYRTAHLEQRDERAEAERRARGKGAKGDQQGLAFPTLCISSQTLAMDRGPPPRADRSYDPRSAGPPPLAPPLDHQRREGGPRAPRDRPTSMAQDPRRKNSAPLQQELPGGEKRDWAADESASELQPRGRETAARLQLTSSSPAVLQLYGLTTLAPVSFILSIPPPSLS